MEFNKLRFATVNGEPTIGGFPFQWGAHTQTFQLAAKSILGAVDQGYYCYDEIFVLAGELLREQPSLSEILCQRFPFVIIDEMQDTSDHQGELLHQVFPRNSEAVVVQRVGDPNQAIFEGAQLFTTDQFPDAACCLHIADSHRFDSSIANLANPFARDPILPDGLKGVRDGGQTTIPHHLFIFPDNDTAGVLGAFGAHVLAQFTTEELLGTTIAALGAVHIESNVAPGDANYPKSVCDYWAGYSPNADRKTSAPTDLAAYFHHARRIMGDAGAVGPSADHVARGIMHLANLTAGKTILQPTSRPNLQLTKLLNSHPECAKRYRNILARFVVSLETLEPASWTILTGDLEEIALALTNCDDTPAPASSFLNWSPPPQLAPVAADQINRIKPNVYRHSVEARHVDIQLSSIHRAKGQTHLATLVLETFYYSHFLKGLLPWLTGPKVDGQDCNGDREIKRLLQMYVAVTRPTHLLCLAMRRSALGTGAAFTQNKDRLEERGWTVQLL